MDVNTVFFDRLFAVIIAFLLPGLVALFGIATGDQTVRTWFQGAQSGPTIAGFIFVLFAALALNLVITAVRWFLFEHLKFKLLGCPWVPAAPNWDEEKRRERDALYVDIRHQHYYHYLASANMAVAIPFAVLAWKIGSVPAPSWTTFIVVVLVGVGTSMVLGLAACDALRRFDRKVTKLLSISPAA